MSHLSCPCCEHAECVPDDGPHPADSDLGPCWLEGHEVICPSCACCVVVHVTDDYAEDAIARAVCKDLYVGGECRCAQEEATS